MFVHARALLAALAAVAFVRAQAAAPPATDFKPSVKVSGFVQGRYTQNLDRDDAPAVSGSGASATSANGFSVPRARLRASGEAAKNLGFVVEGDLANTGSLLTDGYARLSFVPFTEIRLGQQKTQFGYENPEGDTRLLVINRTFVSNALGREQNGANRASGDTRDLGVGVLGKLPVAGGLSLEWAGTVVNGSGTNRSTDDAVAPQKDFWGRAGPALKVARSTIRAGASVGRGYDVASSGTGTAVEPSRYLFRRVGVDVQVDTPWMFVAGEFVRGTDDLRPRRLLRGGAYVYAYGKSPWNAGPIFRVEGFDPDHDVRGDFQRRYTFGAYYDHLPVNARAIVNFERDHSSRGRDDVLLVQTQVVF